MSVRCSLMLKQMLLQSDFAVALALYSRSKIVLNSRQLNVISCKLLMCLLRLAVYFYFYWLNRLQQQIFSWNVRIICAVNMYLCSSLLWLSCQYGGLSLALASMAFICNVSWNMMLYNSTYYLDVYGCIKHACSTVAELISNCSMRLTSCAVQW